MSILAKVSRNAVLYGLALTLLTAGLVVALTPSPAHSTPAPIIAAYADNCEGTTLTITNTSQHLGYWVRINDGAQVRLAKNSETTHSFPSDAGAIEVTYRLGGHGPWFLTGGIHAWSQPEGCVEESPSPDPSPTVTESPTPTEPPCVDVNAATVEELATVKGINAATAEAIVAARPIHAWDDLVGLNGLSPESVVRLIARGELCDSESEPQPSPSPQPTVTHSVEPSESPSVAPSPVAGTGGGLPNTGANVGVLAAGGVILVVAGGLAYLVKRRRGVRFQA